MTDAAAPLSARWAHMDDRARREYWAGLALRHCRGLGDVRSPRYPVA